MDEAPAEEVSVIGIATITVAALQLLLYEKKVYRLLQSDKAPLGRFAIRFLP